MAYKYSSIFQ